MTQDNGQTPDDLMAAGFRLIGDAIKGTGRQLKDELFTSAVKEGADRFSRRAPSAPADGKASTAREDLLFALADRAVTALEDLALNTAAIRQRFERNDNTVKPVPPGGDPDDSARFGG